MRLLLAVFVFALHCLTAAEPSQLFNGKNLDGFYTFVRDHGVDRDPNQVFRVENGEIHVSGKEYGYFCTKESYENYYLLVEFRWGDKTHEPRRDKARDSGILFHVTGEDKIWPRSIEFQMIEGGTGDIILVDGTSLSVRGETKSKGRFDRFGKGPWQDVAGYRDPAGEVERPLGEWNRLELWTKGDWLRYLVNGILVNEGRDASDRKGKILFQSEGAELYFRKIQLTRLD